MDMLQGTQVINSELIHIGRFYEDILDQQEATSIFNSIVNCITQNLIDILKFAIIDRHDQSQVFITWEYDLSNSQNVIRSGPDLQLILESLRQAQRGKVRLSCDVRWSGRFLSMNKHHRDQILSKTYWGKNVEEVQKRDNQIVSSGRVASGDDETHLGATNRSIDFGPIELDLLKLEAEVQYIDKQERSAFYESIKHCILNGYCQCILFEILSSDQERKILQWKFKLDSNSVFQRSGDSQKQVMALAGGLRANSSFKIIPVLTQKFQGLTAREQHEAMKNTIWAEDFKKKGWFNRS